ncbi:family 43 glycosylhydrolase [Mucilaginibacter mali]|uniref:Family 43 glycosylhydrolase n=2 Tax=Mucilaginibacter mali TaxID=2740462 RepID=A0A7D4UHE0_9SPHI|nr:family 43 glycosylhydrolase [Mucilaginibacter mali]
MAGSLAAIAQKTTVKVRAQSANTFTNPILGGDFPDPSIMRDGKDYYMTHSAFDYLPGLTVWHSTDLVNWEPISYGLTNYLGSIWAPDICKYGNLYYIYFTVSRKGNFVITAKDPHGPWSEPVDLKVDGIDPCHIADETGQRWIFLSGGNRAKLTPDGLSVVPGTLEKVYSGWKIPDDWITEGMAMEGPKLKKIGQYYYWLSAEGGTAGPPTSHMEVVARSKSINGPWENAPNNPLIHTYSGTEKWWSKGHASLIDAPDGRWWIVYHAYQKDFMNLGRQTLLEPVTFLSNGWIKAPTGKNVAFPMAKPVSGSRTTDRLSHLGEYRIGLDWKFYKKYDAGRASAKDGVLTLKAQGTTPQESGPMLFVAGTPNYEFSVKINKDADAVAGLTLFYNADFFVGVSFDNKFVTRWRKGAAKGRVAHTGNNELWLKMRIIDNVATIFHSYNGTDWIKEEWGLEVSGYNHNTLYDFQSILPGFFAYGKGDVKFSNFKFNRL